MSYFDDASLVMIPSGYKDQKVYSVKPIDGSGDLTFSRASNATRVNSSGLVEKVRTNLILQSNQFDNAYWNKTAATIATGQADPNGGADAFKIVEDTTTNFHRINGAYTMVSGNAYATSVTAKAAGRNFLTMSNNVASGTAIFNLSNGSISVQESAVIYAKATDLGGGWYRCEMVAVGDKNGSYNVFLGADDDGTTGTYLGDGTSGVFIFQSQLEVSDFGATPYIPTTTAAVSVGPVSGLPRLDYSGGASCPSLLLEPQRTNLVIYSEQFDNAAWTKQTGITITANTTETLDPSGYYGADKIVSTSGSTGFFQAGLSLTSDIVRSIYLKGAVGGEQVKIKDPSGFGGSTTHTLTTSWARYEHKTTNTGDTYQGLFVDDITNGATIYAWGAQIEAGAYATSYIPTLSSAVTRVADAASKTGISSLIGQTEGTLYWEGYRVNSANFGTALVIDDTTTTNRIYILTTIDGFRIDVTSGGTSSAFYTGIFSEGTHKIAVAYNSSAVDIYIDGVSVYNDTSVTIPACSRLVLGNWSGNTQESRTSQALLFKTRLSNADLATLTA